MILRCPNCNRKLECDIEAGVEFTLDCPACNEPFTIAGEEATHLSSKHKGIKFQLESFEDEVEDEDTTIAEVGTAAADTNPPGTPDSSAVDAADKDEEEEQDVLLVETGNILVDVVNAKSEMVAINPGSKKKALVN